MVICRNADEIRYRAISQSWYACFSAEIGIVIIYFMELGRWKKKQQQPKKTHTHTQGGDKFQWNFKTKSLLRTSVININGIMSTPVGPFLESQVK